MSFSLTVTICAFTADKHTLDQLFYWTNKVTQGKNVKAFPSHTGPHGGADLSFPQP